MESKFKCPPYLRREGESLVFNNPKGDLVFFVPEVYFTRKDAVELGDFVELFGMFSFAIEDENGKYDHLHNFKFPTKFMSKPGSMEKVKDLKLTKTTPPSNYRILKYKKDDIVVVSVKVAEDVDNMEQLFKMFIINTRIPNTIRYDEMQDYFMENAALNGNKYKLSLQLFGILISKVIRDKNDISKLYRLSGSKDMTEYATLSVADIPKYMSPYAAIVSQNWDEAVMASILSTKDDVSHLQQIMTG